MIKDIKYNGHTAQPSDYECNDGDLAISLNIINEDGALHAIHRPSVSLRLEPFMSVAIIHKTSHFLHFIIIDRRNNNTYWIDSESISSDGTPRPDSVISLGSFPSNEIYDMECIGNIVVVATSEGMDYFMWDSNENDYTHLGKIPEIDIEMALGFKNGMETGAGSSFSFSLEDSDSKYAGMLQQILQGSLNPGRDSFRPIDTETKSVIDFVSDAVIANLNKYVADTTADNYFLQPFFVRYAYRLFDGSSIMVSAPVLMIPNSYAPLVKINRIDNDADLLNCHCSILFTPASLVYRILSDTSSLGKWKNIITHIDFFVTPQTPTFEQSDKLDGIGHRMMESDIVGRFSHIGHFKTSATRDGSGASGFHRPNNPSSPLDSDLIPQSNLEIHYNVENARFFYVKSRSLKEIESSITSASLFYRIASIDFDEIVRMDLFKKIDIKGKSLSTLSSLPRLDDNSCYNHSFVPKNLYSYNARLSLANVSVKPFSALSIRSLSQFSFKGDTSGFSDIRIFVRLKSSGKSIWIKLKNDSSYPLADKSPFAYDSIAENFPRWLFYPDSAATEMIVAAPSGYWRLPLSSHDFINGAYWFRGLSSESPVMTPGPVPDDITISSDTLLPLYNRIVTSEVNNPFYFPLLGFVAVGSANIYTICSAAKALSQGQFGQYPLYAFTDNGVWALEVSSTGSYSARQPITRDVILKNTTPLQLDNAVLFATERGIMLISGSQTQCISDVVNSTEPLDFSQLPGIDRLHSMLGHNVDTCLPTVPFLEFIAECGMLYDYVHQRVIVYNPHYTYAYVYSLKSGKWGMMYSTISSGINSYPEALAVDHDGAVLNFSSLDGEPTKGLFVSRPLKLEMPDLLKTVDTVIQRGHFRKGHVQSVLYGSRDLFNWHLIWSGKNHCLRGFRGTPYKYFRIACVASLSDDESIFGVSMQFNPRLTNQPR